MRAAITARRQRGFTLVELMVALVVSSLMVGMILAIFSRMSMAYRGQQQIAGLQQVLAAARAAIEADAKQAGFGMPQGFRFAADTLGEDANGPRERWPVRVIDSDSGPDQIAFFYGNPSSQGVVTGGTLATNLQVTVDPPTGFASGDLVLLTTPTFDTLNPGGGANLTSYRACLLQIANFTQGTPATITFAEAPPYGRVGQTHCGTAPINPGTTMIYKFVARGYRIDSAARPELGALQLSETGGLLNSAADNWTDIAYGFTDIQSALRVFDDNDTGDFTGDFDLDGIPTKEWLSGGDQTTVTDRTEVLQPFATPIAMTISLVARTDRDVEGISTAATPHLIGPGSGGVNANPLGNRASVALPAAGSGSGAGSAGDPALQGSRIYRYLTFQIDFRNLGVGR